MVSPKLGLDSNLLNHLGTCSSLVTSSITSRIPSSDLAAVIVVDIILIIIAIRAVITIIDLKFPITVIVVVLPVIRLGLVLDPHLQLVELLLVSPHLVEFALIATVVVLHS